MINLFSKKSLNVQILKNLRNLSLHEYQCKEILRNGGINVQKFFTINNDPASFEKFNNNSFNEYVIKSQILAGGRGKGKFVDGFTGGVHLTKDKNKAIEITKKMLNNTLVTKQTGEEGLKVNNIMIADALDITEEKYIAILLDNELGCPVILGSPMGGMDIEEVAKKNPEKILKICLDINCDIQRDSCIIMANFLGIPKEYHDNVINQIVKLYRIFLTLDATQIEINPFAFSPTINSFICIDSKFNIDEKSKFRHESLFSQEDKLQINPLEIRASEFDMNYISLDGNIACIVNGAGLAMATMDIIQYYGGKPANFLDLGGTITSEGVVEAVKIVSAHKNVEKIFINIFGGIVNCAVIAEGIVKAVRSGEVPNKSIVLRLKGTNSDIAKIILNEENIENIKMIEEFEDAAKQVTQ